MTAGADKLIAGSSLLIRIPKKMPNNWILKQIAFPPPKEDFFSRTGRLGKLLPPRISLEEQQQIRLTCKLAGIDPVKVVGLPAEELALQSAYSLYAKSDKTLVQVIRYGHCRIDVL